MTHSPTPYASSSCELNVAAAECLFHIAERSSWLEQRELTHYVPAEFKREGFIHLSTGEQVRATAARYYQGRTDICLLVLARPALEAHLKWENLRGGAEIFPHLYARLTVSAVVDVLAIRWEDSVVRFVADA